MHNYLLVAGGDGMLRCHIQVSDWRRISSCCHSHGWQCNTDHVTFIHCTVLSMQRHQAWAVAVVVWGWQQFSASLSFRLPPFLPQPCGCPVIANVVMFGLLANGMNYWRKRVSLHCALLQQVSEHTWLDSHCGQLASHTYCPPLCETIWTRTSWISASMP